ncbi:MAG: TatD family hydrolase [Candidatus Aenigmarchaeota archaeon]|nr:TatD family hydrolase [Candidatus Aenigmarchaeota archaeon]
MIDSHCHLEQSDYSKDLDKIILKCKKELKAIITSCAHPNDFEKTLEIVNKNKGFVFCTVGIHPEYIKEITDKQIDVFLDLIRKNKDGIVGIGEIGLDYHWIKESDQIERQKQMFIKLLRLAKELDKPVVIHSREALPETLDILEQEEMKDVLLHMWGGHTLMDKVNELGYNVSMNSIIVSSKSYGKVVKRTPLEKLMLETDSPWLAVKEDGNSYKLDPDSRNDSLTIKITAQKIAELKDIDFQKIWKQCALNSNKFFKLHLNI